jgi:hypothetical protein
MAVFMDNRNPWSFRRQIAGGSFGVRWQAERDTAFVTAGPLESAVAAPLCRRTPYAPLGIERQGDGRWWQFAADQVQAVAEARAGESG